MEKYRIWKAFSPRCDRKHEIVFESKDLGKTEKELEKFKKQLIKERENYYLIRLSY